MTKISLRLSWQNFKTTNTTEPTCDSSSLFSATGNLANSLTISNADHNKWVCFRVSNAAGEYSYIKHQIKLEVLTVSVSQTGEVITATATLSSSTATARWYYSEHVDDPVCKDIVDSDWGEGSSVKYANSGRYYCFKVVDTNGNIGYGKHKALQPTLQLEARQLMRADSTYSHRVLAQALNANPINPSLFSNSKFGYSVSLDGDRLAVGVPDYGFYNELKKGTVFIYKKTGATWTLEQELSNLAWLDTFQNEKFGYSVSLDGERLAVGVPYMRHDVRHPYIVHSGKGGVAVFKRIGTSWVVEANGLQCNVLNSRNFIINKTYFGQNVSLSGNVLVASGVGDIDGTTCIFQRSGDSWVLRKKITGKTIGRVATDGKHVLLVYRSVVYIYETTDLGGRGTSIRVSNADFSNATVAIEGDRLAVGAPRENGYNGINTGAVYIFKKTGETWNLEQEISDTAPNFIHLQANDAFGSSVSLDGDRLAVGAPEDDGKSGNDTGAVYIFKRTATTWTLEQEISDGGSFMDLDVGDEFGSSISLDGDLLVVGVPEDDTLVTSGTGSTYIFEKSTNNRWSDTVKIRDNTNTIETSWQRFLTADTTAPNCDAGDASRFVGVSRSYKLRRKTSYNGRWLCFRVKNNINEYSYLKHQIDTVAPVITVTQTGGHFNSQYHGI